MLAIPWYFTKLIHQEQLFTYIYVVVTSASLLWGIYAGTLIDRYSRKRIFLAINAVGLAVLGTASVTGFIQHDLHWAMVAMVFATTVFIYNIHFPALYAFAQEITQKEQYGKVTSQLEVQGQLTWTISGGLAAMLLSGFDWHTQLAGLNVSLTIQPWSVYEIFAIDAATYLISLFLIWQIQTMSVEPKQIDTAPLFDRIKTGFGFLRRHPVLFWFGNASLLVFLTIIVEGTLVNPIYVDHVLHRGGNVYAMSDMFFSLGALLSGYLIHRVVAAHRSITVIVLLCIIAAVVYVMLVYNTWVPLFFVAHFIIGACNSAVRVLRVTYLFNHIPNSIIGRANSVFFMINVALRISLTGLFASTFFHTGSNIAWANAVMAAICLAGGIIIWQQRPALVQSPVVKDLKQSA